MPDRRSDSFGLFNLKVIPKFETHLILMGREDSKLLFHLFLASESSFAVQAKQVSLSGYPLLSRLIFI